MALSDDPALRIAYGGAPTMSLFLKAIGLATPKLEHLRARVESDLTEVGYGVSWWFHHHLARHILISDHLCRSLSGVATNIAEAELHRREWAAWCAEEDRFTRYAASSRSPAGPIPTLPPRARPLDDLPIYASEMHLAGFVRALGSSLDCLAACVIAIAAIERDLLKADLDKVREHLRGKGKKRLPNPLEPELLAAIDGAISAAGPRGWYEWLSSLRNTYVHRPRRYVLRMLTAIPGLLRPDGRPNISWRTTWQLPAESDFSDIEAFAEKTVGPVLSEDANTTTNELIRSVLYVCEVIAETLAGVWERRREGHPFLVQPEAQWRTIPRSPQQFAGYQPGAPFRLAAIVGNPYLQNRLRWTGLADGSPGSPWK